MLLQFGQSLAIARLCFMSHQPGKLAVAGSTSEVASLIGCKVVGYRLGDQEKLLAGASVYLHRALHVASPYC